MSFVHEVAGNIAAKAVAEVGADALPEDVLSQISHEDVREAIREELSKAIDWAIASVIDQVVNKRGSPQENFDVPPPVPPF